MARDLPFDMGRSDRGLLVGMTGSGKSTLARVLLSNKYALVVIDPKHSFEPAQDFVICHSLAEVQTAAQSRDVALEGAAIVYRPSMAGLERDEIEPVYAWIFNRGNTFVYNDELFAIIPNPMVYPRSLRAIHTQGRSRGIGILNGTQRPSGLPGFVYSETDSWYKFPLQTPEDTARVADYMGRAILEPRTYPVDSVHKAPYTFYYYRTGTRANAEPFELDIKG